MCRGLGPWGPNLVRKYTSARFNSYSTGDILTEEESNLLTEYVYHTLAAKASGELCLKYIFSFGAFARSPLIRRFLDQRDGYDDRRVKCLALVLKGFLTPRLKAQFGPTAFSPSLVETTQSPDNGLIASSQEHEEFAGSQIGETLARKGFIRPVFMVQWVKPEGVLTGNGYHVGAVAGLAQAGERVIKRRPVSNGEGVGVTHGIQWTPPVGIPTGIGTRIITKDDMFSVLTGEKTAVRGEETKQS
ncbi:hypothetical protein GIB67_004751 [Kingdonia uniflora]|uniref:Uncharacterized protein n=1 Tax=Kingdonia uniflora TaxID=39325 RepID=A0A7J7NQY8_9MAGN|nr:hypothetical protein GIB67_004751 [Kingdonia uniflora]